MEMKLFTERLKQARQKKDLNYKQLSVLSGVTSTALSNYEKGDKMPNLESATKIAAALGVSLDWLCGLKTDCDLILSFETMLTELPYDINSYKISFNVLPNNLYDFAVELQKIKEIERANILTDEMILALINATKEKYLYKMTDGG